jgi:hypothetical protein
MKFTDDQKELLALLPKELKNSKELTDSAKLVLSNIIFLYGMEDAQKNGYVFRTNFKMMEETGIKSEHTLIGAVRLLELLGYAETKRGKRNEASTYKLLINCSNNCSNKSENCSNNCSNEIKTLQNEVLLLQKQVVLLQKEIENLKNCSKKCSTDIDIDEDIDKDITTGILDMKDLGPKVTEIEKENKKEKVNEMKNAVLNEMERKDNEMITSTSGERNTNFNVKEPVYGNLTDELFDEIFGLSSTEVDDDTTGDKVSETENEMSDNGTSAMNAKNEITTSNSGDGEHKVQSDKVTSNCSIFTENCPRNLTPPNAALPPLSLNAAGDVETRSVEQLPTSEDKNAPGGKKTPNNAYNLQQWMTKYNKIISDIENTDVEDCHFDTLLDEGCKLIENFPTNEGNYKRQMQDLRYWVARKVDFQKSFKISEKWNKYYRAA